METHVKEKGLPNIKWSSSKICDDHYKNNNRFPISSIEFTYNIPSSKVHPRIQKTEKIFDERGYYKGVNLLSDLKEMESLELIKQTHPQEITPLGDMSTTQTSYPWVPLMFESF